MGVSRHQTVLGLVLRQTLACLAHLSLSWSELMQKLSTQSEWIARAQAVLPASGFGNFDPSIVIARGEGSHIWDEDGKE